MHYFLCIFLDSGKKTMGNCLSWITDIGTPANGLAGATTLIITFDGCNHVMYYFPTGLKDGS